MSKFRAYLIAAALSLAATVAVWAQEPASQTPPPAQQPAQPEKPVQPAKPEDQQPNPNPDEPPVSPVVAGTVYNAPLTGANEPPFDVFRSRSFLVPALGYYGQLDSNGHNTPFGNFASINSIFGAVSIQKMARASEFNLNYLIGRTFSNQASSFDSTVNDFAAAYLWSRGRWDGFVTDRLLYSSESSFLGGYAPFPSSFGSISGFGMTPLIIRSTFMPDQGIFTNFGPRLNNLAVVQVNNHISRRTFFTVVADDNLLHFTNSGLIDSSTAGFQAGLGFQRTREDAIAVIYRFNDLWFNGYPVRVRDNIIELAYQRQLAQRWSFQMGAGPELSDIHAPSQLTGQPNVNTTRSSWAADASIYYRLRRTGLTFGYNHFLTAGGGVFLGSISDGVYATASHELSRLWTLSFTGSYNHNKNLIPIPAGVAGSIFAPANATYNSVYGSFNARRRVGRESEVFFGYLARYQTSNYTLCQTATSVCLGPSIVGHQFNFGFVWRIRPVPVG
jgi:hypothetical protein